MLKSICKHFFLLLPPFAMTSGLVEISSFHLKYSLIDILAEEGAEVKEKQSQFLLPIYSVAIFLLNPIRTVYG